MALYGYKPKTRKAPWVEAFKPKSPAGAPPSARRHIQRRRPIKTPHKPSRGQWIARKTRVRPVSKRQRARNAEYNRAAVAEVDSARERGDICPVAMAIYGKAILVEQVHHIRGRLGPLLMDRRGWLLVSGVGHAWIDANRDDARARGWLCQRGDWHKPFGQE